VQPTEFTSETPGRLVPCPLGGPAFVPAPLPPALGLDWDLAAKLARATHAVGALAGVARTLPNPHLLINPFIRREAVLSSRIEGTRSTLSDLVLFEAGGPSASGLEDVKEVANYVTALEYGRRRLSELPLSLRLIREMHRELMRGVRGENQMPGEFRRDQNWIGGVGIATATFVPPPVPEMNAALDAFEKYLHAPSKLPALVRFALIHYQFEAIHPFADGNGRIGRLLLTLLFLSENLIPEPLLYVSAYFEKHRREYYDLLLGVSQAGRWTGWIAFFLSAIEEQAQDAVSRSNRLLDLKERFQREAHAIGATVPMLKLIERLFDRPAFAITDVAKELELTHRGAALIIEKLVSAGIVREMTGQARNRVFACVPILDIVGEGDPKPSAR
jgi:Fic family protein